MLCVKIMQIFCLEPYYVQIMQSRTRIVESRMRSQVTFLHSVNKATYEELVIYILSVHITVQLRKESGISFHSSVSYARAGSSKKKKNCCYRKINI